MSTIAEVIKKLENFGSELPEMGVHFMKQEVPVKTGALERSVNAERLGQYTWSIGTSIEYAKYVNYGRGPVRPVRAKALRWYDGGEPVFSMYASPTPPNNFAARTAQKLRAWIRSYL